MKHKVKVVEVTDDLVSLMIDGRMCSYLIARSTPLTTSDAQLLRATFDARMLQRFWQSVAPMTLGQRLVHLFQGVWCSRNKTPYELRDLVADYLEKVGTEVTLDNGTKAIVILKSDIDKVRKGGLT